MKVTILIPVLLAFLATAIARTMDRCSLAREMSSLGVPRHELSTWACIAFYESSYRTHIIGPQNPDGSYDYGIFQINDRYWCHNGKFSGKSANGCNIACDRLLSDNIAASVSCAQVAKKQSQSGWGAWTVYNRCLNPQSVDDCF